MAEENTAGTENIEGQSGMESAKSITHYPETGNEQGQSAASETNQTTNIGTGQGEDYVFDPQEYARLTENLPDDVKQQATALQKQLQAAFTKKTQALAKERQKIDAYDAFNANPLEQLKQMASRMGYQLTGMNNQGQQQQESPWEPQTWEEVLNRAGDSTEQRIMERLKPLFNEFQSMKKTSIESQLSEIDPGWQQYEESMMSNLQTHPTLAHDPAMLYRLSVPQEVLESRATQRALKKMENKVNSSKVQGGSTTNKQPKTEAPENPTFQQAVEFAKKKLAEQGLHQ